MTRSGTSDVRDLPDYLWDPAEPEGLPGLEEKERMLPRQALEQAKGNRTAAARSLRISRDTMRSRRKKFGLEQLRLFLRTVDLLRGEKVHQKSDFQSRQRAKCRGDTPHKAATVVLAQKSRGALLEIGVEK